MPHDEATSRVRVLLQTDPATRDPAWKKEVEEWLPLARFEDLGSARAAGVGGLDCRSAEIAELDAPGQPFPKVATHALDSGCGLVLTLHQRPALEIGFGAIATYRMFGAWRSPSGWNGRQLPTGRESLQRSEKTKIGAPNKEYLPPFMRTAIRSYLESLGVVDPRVLLVMWPDRGDHRELAFSLARDHIAPPAYSQAMRSLLWFLPEGYQCLAWEAVARFESSAAIL